MKVQRISTAYGYTWVNEHGECVATLDKNITALFRWTATLFGENIGSYFFESNAIYDIESRLANGN